MPRLSLLNMAIGFFVVFLSSCLGVINSFELTSAFLNDPKALGSWLMTISNSAHGHTALFGVVQILFGLSLSYSRHRVKIKEVQTLCMSLAPIGMGPLLMIRGQAGPSPSTDFLGIAIGICMVSSTLAILWHAFGLVLKLKER